jgi:hypothetical protein
MTRLIHDLLEWYSDEEVVKETGLHREAIVVFESFHDRIADR